MTFRTAKRITMIALAALVPAVLAAAEEPKVPTSGAAQYNGPVLTSIAQIRALSPATLELQPPVRLEARVTLYAPRRSYLWVQDDRDGIRIYFRDKEFPVQPGDRVMLAGKVQPGDDGAMIAPNEVQVLSRGKLPDPPVRAAVQLYTFSDENRRVQVDGHVLRVTENATRWQLEMESGTSRYWLEVTKHTNDNVTLLTDATIRARGVCVRRLLERGQKLQPLVLVQNLNELDVLQAGRPKVQVDRDNMPVRPISSLNSATAATNDLVHVQGAVLDQRLGEYVVVRDSSGTIYADSATLSTVSLRERVDLWGTPAWDGERLYLQNAVFRPVNTNSLASAAAVTNAPTPKPSELPVLTKARDVRNLTLERARWEYPVTMRGVVTFYNRQRRQFFVQDDTSGVYVSRSWSRNVANPGDLVEITGVSGVADNSPVVLPSRITTMGTAAMPEARPATLFQLATGQYDSQWIEVRGVVRSLTLENEVLQLKVGDPDGTVFVNIPAESSPTNLVDAVVRLQGVCAARFNGKRQVIGLTVWSPSMDYMQIEELGAANPLNLPEQPIVSVSQFRSRDTLQRRVKVVGVVTLLQSAQSFFVQDADDGIQVLTGAAPDALQPGDRVEVAGYPALGEFGSVLRDAVYQLNMHGPVPPARTVSLERALDPQLHNMRVELEARVTRVDRKSVLTLQVPGWVFEAHCLAPLTDREIPAVGSSVRIAGIYRVLTDEARSPTSFKILLASGQDLRVLENPTWWTVQRTMTVVGILAVVAVVATLWVLMLRRKVRQQTATLQQNELKFRSLVEQSLVGVYIIQHGRFTYVNPRQAEIYGYTPEEMTDRLVEDTVFEADLPLVREQIRRRVLGEIHTVHYSFRGKRKDGSIIHVEVLGSRTEYNGQAGVLGTSLDITERRAAEDALAQASLLLETLLDNTPDYIYFKDRDSRFVRYSRSFVNLLKLPEGGLKGKTDFDLFAEEHARGAYEDEQQIIRTGQPIIGKLERETHMDGRTSWALTTKLPWRDKEGNIIGTFGTSKNVTAIKEAEGKLAYERELFQSLLDHFPDSIYFKDSESRFVRVSRSKTKRTLQSMRAAYLEKHPDAANNLPVHLTSEDEFAKYLIGKTDFDTSGKKSAQGAYDEEQTIMRTGNPVVGKLERIANSDGSSVWMLITKMPWRNTEGKVIGTLGVSREITALKEAEAKLEDAHKRIVETSRLAGMAEVATDVLHNVGNVLNSVNVSCSLSIDRIRTSKIPSLAKVSALLEKNRGRLAEFFTNDPRGQQLPGYMAALAEHLSGEQTAISREMEQLLKHIDHIKQIVAMQQSYAKVAGVTEEISAAQLVEDALHINAAALTRHDVSVRREFEETAAILTEKHKVLQILVNLIRNAKYAMDEAKRNDKLLRIKVLPDGDTGAVKIQVIDNGVGIPQENLTRIFGHGFTTRPDGHGFGLHSSALTVRELGGSLHAHSDGTGAGATFTLVLPQRSPAQSPKAV